MRKVFVILFFLVSCTLFGQRQEIGRIYWEIRNLETPWEGWVPENHNRNDYKTYELHFRSTIDESKLPPVSPEIIPLMRQYGVRSPIEAIVYGETGPHKPHYYVIKEKTNNSFIIQVPFHDKKSLEFLLIFVNILGKIGHFESTVIHLCNMYDNQIEYEYFENIKHEEYYWTNNFEVYGYHRYRAEYGIYLK
jgi:hypothetical protein